MKKYEAVIILNPNLSSKVDTFKKDFDDLSTSLKDLAYSYIEKYSPSKQQLKVHLMKKVLLSVVEF